MREKILLIIIFMIIWGCCYGHNKDSIGVYIFNEEDDLVCVLNAKDIEFTCDKIFLKVENINCEIITKGNQPYKILIKYKKFCFYSKMFSFRSSFLPKDNDQYVLYRFFDNHIDLFFRKNNILREEYESLVDAINSD